MSKVYTLGYAQPGAQQRLEELMQDPSMILVDTRMLPRTRYAPWDCTALMKTWGDRYRWGGKVLGNVNYKGGPIKIADPLTGLNRLLDWLQRGHNLVLLCGCKNYDTCHRSHIVNLLKTGLDALPSLDVEIMPETTVEVMKCLSIRQPYTDWIVHPERFLEYDIKPKKIENRDWKTSYRGPVLLHASRAFEEDAFPYYARRAEHFAEAVSNDPNDYTKGAIIGVADLIEIVEDSGDPWFCGDYGWVFEHVQALKEPVPYRGALQLFEVPLSVVQSVLPERMRVLA